MVLKNISTQTDINFIYADNLLDNKKISCNIKNKNIDKALFEVFEGSDISYKMFQRNSYVLFKTIPPKKPKQYNEVVVTQEIAETDTLELLKAPVLLSANKPIYPADAVKGEIEGRVGVKFLVTKLGDVAKANIQSSSGSALLDSATIIYTRNLKFIPAQARGTFCNMWLTMTFDYHLKESESSR